MRLSDVMSNAGLQTWATVGLIIAFAAFVGVLIVAFIMPKRSVDAAARLPLEDDPKEK